MNITEMVKQFKKASEESVMGEKMTSSDLLEYRQTCGKVKKFYEKSAMEMPVGFVDIQELGSLLSGGAAEVSHSSRAYVDGDPEFPSMPLYLIGPAQVIQMTLSRLAEDTKQNGLLSSDELQAMASAMQPGAIKEWL